MRVKVLGTTREGNSFNEIFTLDNNATGADLRLVVSEKLEGAEVELLCMGRNIQDSDEVPPGCVMHMRLVRPPVPEPPKKEPKPSKPEPKVEKAIPERDVNEAAEVLYDSEDGVEEVLGADWNDPEVIREYRERLEERGVDPEVAQRHLEKTLKTIKKYQHYVLFFIVSLIMELFISPPLSHTVSPDPETGWRKNYTGNLKGFAKIYAMFDYITILSIWWYITLAIAFLILIGTCMGHQSERLLRFYRFCQFIFLSFNVWFLVASAFYLEPFKRLIERGVWVSLATTVCLVSCFRLARIYVSLRYWRVYKLLKKDEREFAHGQLNPVNMCQATMQQQQVQQIQMPQPQPGEEV